MFSVQIIIYRDTRPYLLNIHLHHLWLIHMLHTWDPFPRFPQTRMRVLKIQTSTIAGMAYLGKMRSLLPMVFQSSMSNIKVGVIIPILPQTVVTLIGLIMLQLLRPLWHLPGLNMTISQDLGLLCVHLFMVVGKLLFVNSKYQRRQQYQLVSSLHYVSRRLLCLLMWWCYNPSSWLTSCLILDRCQLEFLEGRVWRLG